METKVIREEENIRKIQSILGSDVSEPEILRALSQSQNNPDAAINFLLDTPRFITRPVTVKRTNTSTGARISTQIKQEADDETEDHKSLGVSKPMLRVKEEPVAGLGNNHEVAKGSVCDCKPTTEVRESKVSVKEVFMREENLDSTMSFEEFFNSQNVKVLSQDECKLQKSPIVKKEVVTDGKIGSFLVDDSDFPEEADWLLVGRTTATGLSTSRGRKLEYNEIVDFIFPATDSRNVCSSKWINSKASAASSGIVRFSTRRSGEVFP